MIRTSSGPRATARRRRRDRDRDAALTRSETLRHVPPATPPGGACVHPPLAPGSLAARPVSSERTPRPSVPHLPLGQTQLVVSRIGLGLAAVARPGYITLGRARDLAAD